MRCLIVLLLLASCHSREVTVVLADKSEVHVETSATESRDTAEIRIAVTGQCIVPLLVVPAPFGYRVSPTLAEKP